MDKKIPIKKILSLLDRLYPNAHCTLDYTTPLELLVATVLSAQCTDLRVNKVTPDLFATYSNAKAYADAELEELEILVHSTGFFRNKAKNIKACGQILNEKYDGKIPTDLDALVALPGIGRKTANVIMGNAFNIASGVVVDTHVTRLSNRLGLSKTKNAIKIEQDLNKLVPKNKWVKFSHQLILHGRNICVARKPKCGECDLRKLCSQVGV